MSELVRRSSLARSHIGLDTNFLLPLRVGDYGSMTDDHFPLDYHVGDGVAQDVKEMLHYAEMGNLVQVEKYILNRGVPANSKDKKDGSTALHLAAGNRVTGGGGKEMIDFLITQGADPGAQDNQGFTALHAAAQSGRVDAVAALLSHVDDDAKKKSIVNMRNIFGGTALHAAAADGSLHCAIELVKRGADVNAARRDGATPLFLAVHPSKNVDIAAFLAEAGADVTRKNNLGETALHYAACHNMVSLCRLLLEKGACVDARDDTGRTPLHFAAAEGHEDVCRLLCDEWHAVLSYDNNRQSQLDVAKRYHHPRLWDYMLEYGKKVAARKKELQRHVDQHNAAAASSGAGGGGGGDGGSPHISAALSHRRRSTVILPGTPEQKSLDDLPSSPLAKKAAAAVKDAQQQSTGSSSSKSVCESCAALTHERDELRQLIERERCEWRAQVTAMKQQTEKLMHDKDKEIARLQEVVHGAVAARRFEVDKLEKEIAKLKGK